MTDSMSPEVRAEYEQALARAAVKNGSIVDLNASFYGWHDWRASKHVIHCELTAQPDARAEETTWHEFQGTFYEGDTSVHGVEVSGVSCRCGQYANRQVRWSATVSEVAEAVFVEAFGARRGERSI